MKMHTLLDIFNTFGKKNFNTLTKYPSIKTLHKLDSKGILTEELHTDISLEQFYASEKLDGTNVRIIMYKGKYILGSREQLLHYSDDILFDPSQSIVEEMENYHLTGLLNSLEQRFHVIYGELFGGKTSSMSKAYGKEKTGFRVFDVATYDLDTLYKLSSLDSVQLSNWREHEDNTGNIVYGQTFYPLHKLVLEHDTPTYLNDYELFDTSHTGVLSMLNRLIPETTIPLTETATKKPEGIIIRNSLRTKIYKLRYEDYLKVCKNVGTSLRKCRSCKLSFPEVTDTMVWCNNCTEDSSNIREYVTNAEHLNM